MTFAREWPWVEPPIHLQKEIMGLFDKIKQGLKKTSQLLNTDVRDLFKSQGRLIDEAFLEELSAILIKTDMGVVAAQAIVDEDATKYRAHVMQTEDVLATVKAKLKELMAQGEEPIRFASEGPTVIMVAGVNGAGKTTSIAKLAQLLKSQGKSVVLGAGDTFRAAAVEQLTVWADRLGVEIVKGEQGADPASVAHRAVARAIESKADACIVDTAGRLQNKSNLMDELAKVRRVAAKEPGHVSEVLLVLDATTGQNGLTQAKVFTEAVEVTGVVLTKLDGSAKGGIVFAVESELGIPVKLVGLGEQVGDLVDFEPEEFVDALFE